VERENGATDILLFFPVIITYFVKCKIKVQVIDSDRNLSLHFKRLDSVINLKLQYYVDSLVTLHF